MRNPQNGFLNTLHTYSVLSLSYKYNRAKRKTKTLKSLKYAYADSAREYYWQDIFKYLRYPGIYDCYVYVYSSILNLLRSLAISPITNSLWDDEPRMHAARLHRAINI